MIKGEVADRARRLASERTPFVVATVVSARRPTSVRPGDGAVVHADGTIDGFVGGVCAESSVRLHSLRALETGEPVLLRLVPGQAGGDIEAPTGGIEAATEGAVVEHNPCLSGGALEIFLEPQLPAPRIVVVGVSPIARAVRELARASGYDVADGNPREAAAVIVASHGLDEERMLVEALSSGVPYVGLVASRLRGAAVRAALDFPDELRAQLHTPAGLDIGARTPPEIAISILAEIVADSRGRPRGQPASETDPVCGMRVSVADSAPHLDGPDGRLYFCSEHCRDAYARGHAVAS